MPDIFNQAISLVAFVAILGLLVFVHELGHFLAAKLSGVVVEEFAFGFGKSLWKREYKGTLYKINLLPFGGYVTLQGEKANSTDTREGSYSNKPLYKKLFILVAGVTMNMILAVLLFGIYLATANYQLSFRAIGDYNFVGTEQARLLVAVIDATEGSPASGKLGFGDVITTVNGTQLVRSEQFTEFLNANEGKEVSFGVIPVDNLSAEPRIITTTLRDSDTQQPLLGIGYSNFYVIDYPKNFLVAFPHTLNMFGYQLSSIADLIEQSIAKSDAKIALREVGGVIAVGNLVGEVVALGEFTSLINLTALLSVTLAFFNILPFPLLDGGQAVVEILQSATGRRIPDKLINVVNNLGFIFLILLSILITFKDVIQFNLLENLISGLRSVLGR